MPAASIGTDMNMQNSSRFRRSVASCFVLLSLVLAFESIALPVDSGHVEAEIVSERQSIQPGTPFWLAVRLKMDPHWHTYWKNAGDAGLGTRIKWTVPEGFKVSELYWPHPEWIEISGLANFGYEDEVLLLTQITPPSSLSDGSEITLKAKGDWLVCKDVCVPEGADLEITLPVKVSHAAVRSNVAAAFSAARDALPFSSKEWGIRATIDDDFITAVITAPSGWGHELGEVKFFPAQERVIQYVDGQTWDRDVSDFRLNLKRSKLADDEPIERLQGILVSERGWDEAGSRKSLNVDVSFGAAEPAMRITSAQDEFSLGIALFYAFIGGLILNLMPCVFPVLGLKIMGFVQQAGEDKSKIKLHGLVFSLGVLVSFWILAAILIAIRAGGQELGWGFQLQSPMFVFALTVILFVFALNLSGLFEFGLSMTRMGGGIASSKGLSGSFFSGALATLVATPCAAPFLAPALGVALTLAPAQSITVFTFIALGLAFPYLLISIFPGLLRVLPRPGAWMETFKQAMSFLLYATVAYLVWVLEGQLEEKGFLTALFALVVIGLAGWIYGRWTAPVRKGGVRLAGTICALVLFLSGLGMGVAAQKEDALKWEPWSLAREVELLAEGRPVYVDFTARWCATCQVNKRVAFSSPKVISALLDKNVATLKADWTNQDPKITKRLAEYGRSAVPFNILYFPDGRDPEVLPEILTPAIVLEALNSKS